MFLMQVAINAIRPIVSYRALALGAGPASLGAIAASFAVLSFVLAIPIGRLVDALGEIRFVAAGTALIAVVAFGLVRVESLVVLGLTQAVLGLGQILTVVGTQTLIANAGPQRRDARFGIFTVVVSLGQLTGPALAGVIAGDITIGSNGSGGDRLAGANVFASASGMAVLACLLALSLWRATPARPAGAARDTTSDTGLRQAVGKVLRLPSIPQAMFASVAVLTTSDILVAYLPAYGEAAGISVSTVGFLLSVRAGASMLSRVFLGVLIRRLGRRRLLIASTALPAVTLGLLPLLGDSPVLFLLMAVAGLGLGLGQPVSLTWVAGAAPAGIRGTAIAVRLTGNRFGQIVVPGLVGGLVGLTGIGIVFWALAAMLSTSSALTATGSFDRGT